MSAFCFCLQDDKVKWKELKPHNYRSFSIKKKKKNQRILVVLSFNFKAKVKANSGKYVATSNKIEIPCDLVFPILSKLPLKSLKAI